jgi:hypothetical protein
VKQGPPDDAALAWAKSIHTDQRSSSELRSDQITSEYAIEGLRSSLDNKFPPARTEHQILRHRAALNEAQHGERALRAEKAGNSLGFPACELFTDPKW